MLAIKNNLMAFNAARHLGTNYDNLSTSVERLSSGLRITSAKDDAAGLAVRELMRADIAVLQQGSRNAGDGISMLQTMEGAMQTIDDCLIRMKELAEQAATGSYSDEQRKIINAEFEEMAAEIDRIAGNTSFNGINMLNETTTEANGISIHVGSTETINIAKVDMTKDGLGIKTGKAGYYEQFTDTVTDPDAAGEPFFSAAAAATMTIQFTDSGAGDDEQAFDVDFATGDYTLQEVCDAINTKSQNLGNDADGNSLNYKAAEIVQTANGEYTLRLNSRGDDADGATLTYAGGAVTVDSSDGATAAAAASTGTLSDAINILSVDAAVNALAAVEDAIITKDSARAGFGYKINRLESTDQILTIQSENLMTSESRISDVDVATEMAQMTKNQVLAQAGIAMLGQANQMPQMALSLLQG